jgi:bis(5'-nucleosyl)-tetraphosphatase (symmetrical)
MATYAIGDLQGCLDPLEDLLGVIDFSPTRDRLWFTGDLVNRGPQSLEVLRFVKSLGDRAVTVQGNHDLHLLALHAGFGRPRRDDTLDEVLAAPDRAELMTWLRTRPMLHAEDEYVLVHAGLLPPWSVSEASELACEVETQLRAPDHQQFFAQLYGSKPDHWDCSLRGMDRWRIIVNAMTRLRFCSAEGVMEFQTKGEVHKAPPGFMPWFDVPDRASRTSTIVFGHWSALGLLTRPNLLGLDSGCVWGGRLSAVRLEDRRVFQCACPAVQDPMRVQ